MVVLDAFTKVMKMMNHTGQWDAELSWYSLSVIIWICLFSLEHSLRICNFRPPWPCLIVKVLATSVKFLQAPGSNTVVNWTFNFGTTNIFSGFHSLMAKFELKLDSVACSSVQLSNQNQSEAIHNMSAHQLPQYYQTLQEPSTA